MVPGDQLEWHEFKDYLAFQSSCLTGNSKSAYHTMLLPLMSKWVKCSMFWESSVSVMSWQVVLHEPVTVTLGQNIGGQNLLDKLEQISLIYLHLRKGVRTKLERNKFVISVAWC